MSPANPQANPKTQRKGAPRLRIVWAVDPFARDTRLQNAAAQAIRVITEGAKAEIEPVYLLALPPWADPMQAPSDLAAQIRKSGQAALDEFRNRLDEAEPLTVLRSTDGSTRASAQVLLDYASKSGADLIAVSTRANRGLKRMMLGSFAESLVLHSTVPILSVNSEWKAPRRVSQILFATDFSEISHAAFREAMKLAERLGASITLYHKVKYELTPTLKAAFDVYPIYKEVFEKEVIDRENQALEWTKEAKRAGIRAIAAVDSRPSGSITDGILAQARKGASLIAVAAHSGAWKSAVLGSVARHLLRASPLPVWVMR